MIELKEDVKASDASDIDASVFDETDGAIQVLHSQSLLSQEKGCLLAATKRQEIADVDEILQIIGEYGRYQVALTFLLALFMIGSVYHLFSIAFYTLKTPWECTIEGIKNKECLLNGTISDNNDNYSKRCQMNRTSWMYTRGKSFSIVAEFDLMCDKDWLIIFARSIGFAGGLFGTLLFGIISDWFGRKKALFVSFFCLQTSVILQSFAWNIESFLIFHFISGFFLSGIIPLIYVILFEMVGPKRRWLASNIIWVAFAGSLILLGLQAHFVQNWRLLSRILSGPYFILLLVWKLIPESVRWLRVNGRLREAEGLLELVAKVNNKKYPDVKLQDIPEEYQNVPFKELFLDGRCLILLLHGAIWAVQSIIYFTISLTTIHLIGNVHLDFAIVGLTEVPAVFCTVYATNRFGRRRSLILGTFGCVIALIIVSCVSENDSPESVLRLLRASFGVLAKFFISISFASVYLLSSETFPTVVRSRAIHSLEFMTLVGRAIAPWLILGFQSIHTRLPYPILSLLCFLSGLLAFKLEDTSSLQTQEVFNKKRRPSGMKINKLVDNVRDSYSIGSRTNSENRLSVIYDTKFSVT